MVMLDSLEQLQDFGEYRVFMRERLKRLSEEREPIFISKSRLDFQINGNAWKSHGLLFGKKSRMLAQTMRREGAMFVEGVCYSDGKTLVIEGLSEKFVMGAHRTLKRLKLGFEVAGGTGEAADEDDGDGGAANALLQKQAARIEKAVDFWHKTEQLMTADLRKLQRAIQSLNAPHGKAVIRGLETIRTSLDTIDDEAAEAAAAARNGDVEGFEAAKLDFQKKVHRILESVEKNPLIREADNNPEVKVNIRGTLTSSLRRLQDAV